MKEGEDIMPDDFIRRIIRAGIESFLIDEAKKEDILRSIWAEKSFSKEECTYESDK